jgi:hypothetical protein
MFYKEIEIYDSLLSKEGKLNEKNQAQEEINKLKEENQKLRKEIGGLYKKLGDNSNLGQQEITRIMSSISLDTNNIKQAIVTFVSFEKRDIELKIGKKSFHYPLINSPGLPSNGDECLAFIDGGVIQNLFFYKKRPIPFDIVIGKVLFCEENWVKIRGLDRKEWIIEGKNPEENEIIKLFSRNDTVILEVLEKTVIKFKKCVKSRENSLKNELYEEFTRKEIQKEIVRIRDSKGE